MSEQRLRRCTSLLCHWPIALNSGINNSNYNTNNKIVIYIAPFLEFQRHWKDGESVRCSKSGCLKEMYLYVIWNWLNGCLRVVCFRFSGQNNCWNVWQSHWSELVERVLVGQQNVYDGHAGSANMFWICNCCSVIVGVAVFWDLCAIHPTKWQKWHQIDQQMGITFRIELPPLILSRFKLWSVGLLPAE